MGFERARREELPTWLDDEVGQAFEAVRGEAQDLELRKLKDGVLLSQLESAPDDGLDRLGPGYQIERFFAEGHPSYRRRLSQAWEMWKMAGTRGTDEVPSATVQSLHEYGIEDVELREDHEWTGAGGAWFSRYWVLLGPTTPWQPMTMPFQMQPQETTLGTTATAAEVAAVKRQVLKWKSPHAYPLQVIVYDDDATLLGLDLQMPFEMGGGYAARWRLGKAMSVTWRAMPVTLGGWFL